MLKVFVYGSLCKYQENHHYLKGATCLSEQAYVRGRLYSGPSYYPLLMKDEEFVTFGELYEVNTDCLSELDELEGYSDSTSDPLFLREKVDIHTEQGTVEAFTYFWPHEPEGSPVLYNDWKVHRYIEQQSLYYFAFGSCMDEERLISHGVHRLFSEVIGKGVLEDYRLAFSCPFEDGSRADIREDRGQYVEGVVYHINKEALRYLYKREGVESKTYRPTIVTLKKSDGKSVQALSFTVVEKEKDTAPPLHYAIEIHRGGSKHLCPTYMTHLEDMFCERFQVVDFKDYLEKRSPES